MPSSRPKLKARTKVWFESADLHVFGPGLARLLENVDRLGTLQDAAKAQNMSYRYAWNLIKAAEEHLGKTLVLRQAGGAHGGASTLSADGLRMLNAFRQLSKDVAAFAQEEVLTLFPRENADV